WMFTTPPSSLCCWAATARRPRCAETSVGATVARAAATPRAARATRSQEKRAKNWMGLMFFLLVVFVIDLPQRHRCVREETGQPPCRTSGDVISHTYERKTAKVAEVRRRPPAKTCSLL